MSSLLQTKRFMKMGQADAVAQRLGDEGVVFGRMLGEPAAREAFTAFLEKHCRLLTSLSKIVPSPLTVCASSYLINSTNATSFP